MISGFSATALMRIRLRVCGGEIRYFFAEALPTAPHQTCRVLSVRQPRLSFNNAIKTL